MRFLTWLKKSRERILAIGWRLILFQVFSYLFSYPAYIWAMNSMGLMGWLLMTLISLVLSAYLFWHYDHKGIDWLFAKVTRDWEKGTLKSSGWIRRIVVGIFKSKNKVLRVSVFIITSIKIDPLIVAIHNRESHFGGIKLSDWAILAASVLVANLWRGIMAGFFVEILR